MKAMGHMAVVAAMLGMAIGAWAQHPPYVQTRGSVAAGNVAIFQDAAGRTIMASTNVTESDISYAVQLVLGATTTNDVQVGRVLTLKPNGSGMTDYAVVATDTNVGEGSLTLTGGDSSLGDWGSVAAIQLTRNSDLYDGEMTLIAGNNTYIDFLLGANDSTLTIYEDRVDFRGATISNAIFADTNAVPLSRLPAETTLSGSTSALPTSAAISNWVGSLDLGGGTIVSYHAAAVLVSESTVTLSRTSTAWMSLDMTNAVYLTVDTNSWPSGGHGMWAIDVRMNHYALTFDTNLIKNTDGLTLTDTNNYQTVVGSRPYGHYMWEVR